MKKYMVVFVVDGKQDAVFFDDMNKAESFRMDLVCGLGGAAEVYERQEPTEENNYFDGYQFLYA